MFWFSYTHMHGRLVVMDVSEHEIAGKRCFTAAWSEDPRVQVTDLAPDVALVKLTAHMERLLAPRVTFLPEAPAVAAA